MKIQFVFASATAFLHATPALSAGIRAGSSLEEFLERARSNDSLKQCKKQCDREYASGTSANTNCHVDCDNSYNGWNYFPTGGQCRNRCKRDSDCQLGGFNPCGYCGTYVGTEMYQLCYAPNPNEDVEAEVTDEDAGDSKFAPEDLSEDEFVAKAKDNSSLKQCKKQCDRDYNKKTRANSRCQSTCDNRYKSLPGSSYCTYAPDYKCYKSGWPKCCGEGNGGCPANQPKCDKSSDDEDASDLFDGAAAVFLDSSSSGNGYSCGQKCNEDSDCYHGGFVDCGVCNKVHGTYGYNTCISEDTPAPSPAPVWNYFPDGGQCSKHCHKDSDCQKGGFNPCGSCGQYEGTEMYRRCYAPQPEDEDVEVAEM